MAITKSSPAPLMHQQIQRYGVYVNENRAIPEAFDGQKPVHRRLLYAMYSLGIRATGTEVKCARIVGDAVGKYHPHSDTAAYESLVTLINCSNPLAQGEGNFGSPVTEDSEAAQRYTNAKFTRLGLHCFFDPRLLAVTHMVPNYDDTLQEPYLLPARLPAVLLNGGEGIGVAMATKCPSFEITSIIKTVRKYIAAKARDWKLLTGLKLWYPLWGAEVDVSRQRKEWQQLLKTGQARIEFDTVIDVNKKTITLGPFAYGLKPFTSVLGSKAKPGTIRAQPWYKSHYTDNTKDGMRLVLTDVTDVEAAVNWLLKKTTVAHSFNTTVSLRKLEKGVPVIGARKMNILEILDYWYTNRTKLEKAALTEELKQLGIQIRQAELKILAHTNIDKLTQLLKTSNNLVSDVASVLGISKEEAQWLLERQIQQLAKLSISDVRKAQAQWKAESSVKKGLLKDLPRAVLLDLDRLEKELKL